MVCRMRVLLAPVVTTIENIYGSIKCTFNMALIMHIVPYAVSFNGCGVDPTENATDGQGNDPRCASFLGIAHVQHNRWVLLLPWHLYIVCRMRDLPRPW